MTTDAAAIPIYTGQDFYVPYFEVKLAGQPLGDNVIHDITSVSYKDSLTDIDSCDITINNWDADALAFKYIGEDDERFDPGKELELWMGYYGGDSMRLMLTGEITSLKPTFPAAGQPTLGISAMNILHKLRGEHKSRPYRNMKDSAIARQIAGLLEVGIRTDPAAEAAEETIQYLLQENQYDIVFLMERARRLGYDLFVEERGSRLQSAPSALYFGPSDALRRPVYSLEYGRSLIQFQPTLTTANQVGEVVVRGWDNTRKRKIEGKATRADLATNGVGPRGRQQVIERSFNQRQEVIADRPIQTETEAKTLARETLERIAKDMVKGSGSVVGLPDLRAGSVLMIDGLDGRFSGRYFVTSTTHTLNDSGYTTQFECRREELKQG
jgi:uncharacterized protein